MPGWMKHKLESRLLGEIAVTSASLEAQRLKCLPAMWETQVWSLGREDPLEKEMVTHSNILAWRIPWREEPGRLQPTGSQRVGHDWVTSLTHSLRYADDTTLMAESEELKSLLMKVKVEWKSWLKTQHSKNEDHGIQSHYFVANRCRKNGNSDRLYFLGFQNHFR